jgi:PilZ domain
VKHRRHRRVAAQGVAAHANELPGDCNIENISAGGLFLRTSALMPLGMPVRVELTKPSLRAPIVLTGRVVSSVSEAEGQKQDIPPGVGIELDPLTGDTQKRFYALLRDLGLKDLAQPIEPEDLHGSASPDTQQVASNVRGLLDMLTDSLHRIKERDEEIGRLKDQIRKLELQLKTAKR